MNTAALARYANAGPDAPIHADERVALADLPRLADSPQAAADGFRAMLLQRDADALRRQHRIFIDALRTIALGDDDSAQIARKALRCAAFA